MRLGEVDRVARMGQRRAQHAAARQHRGDAFVVELKAVKDQIDAGARRVERRLAANRMGYRLFPHAVRLADDRIGLVLGEGGDQLAIRPALDPIERDLDAIDAVFDLPAHLLDRLVDIGDELADRGRWRADPRRVPVGQPLVRRDIGAGGDNPRAVE